MTGSEELNRVTSYKCGRCGALLEASPDTLLTICRYCGYPNPVIGNIKRESIYIVPSRFDEDTIVKHVETRYRERVVNVEGYYIPIWVYDASIVGEIEYRSIYSRKYSEESGDKASEKYSFETRYSLHISGCRDRDFPGLNEVYQHYLVTKPSTTKLMDLEQGDWHRKGLKILSPSVDPIVLERLSEERITLDVLKDLDRYLLKKVSKLDVDIAGVSEPTLLYLPVWVVVCRRKGRVRQMILSGWDGELVYEWRHMGLPDLLKDTLKYVGIMAVITMFLLNSFLIPYSFTTIGTLYFRFAYIVGWIITIFLLTLFFRRVGSFVKDILGEILLSFIRFERILGYIALRILFLFIGVGVVVLSLIAYYIGVASPIIISILVFLSLAFLFISVNYLLINKLRELFRSVRTIKRGGRS